VPLPPRAPDDATPSVRSHPVIEAALSAARTSYSPATHKAPVRSPSRRAWIAVGLLIALTALPTLVVLLAGRAALRYEDSPDGYHADAPQPVVVAPGPHGVPPRPPAAVAPEGGVSGGGAPSAADGLAGGAVAAGRRPESSPTPAPGRGAAAGSGSGSNSGGAPAVGGGGAPAGGAPPGSGNSGDAVSVPPATTTDQNGDLDEPADDDHGDGSGGQTATPAPGRPGGSGSGSGSGSDSGSDSGSGSGGSAGSGGSTGSGFIRNVLEGLGIRVG
jgi:hypothetical protein